MDATIQQKKDHQLCMNVWHLLRDFGDLTNTEQDDARWREFLDLGDQAAGRDPEAKALVCIVEDIVHQRSIGQPITQTKPHKDEQDLLKYFRRLDSSQKKMILQMLKAM